MSRGLGVVWWGLHLREGRIISDHSYLNRRDWPGISELLGESPS